MDKVIQDQIDKTLQELSQSRKPIEKSRVSKTSNGYIFLISWSNANLLRVLVKKFTNNFPKSLYRLKNQMDDAARSVVANIEEGFARPTTAEYIKFLGFSRASLIEVKGDIQRCLQDGILKLIPDSSLKNLGIDLLKWHEALKQSVISRPMEFKGTYRNLEETRAGVLSSDPLISFKFLYDSVDNLIVNNLTYEIFIELINKTDWNIRKLVESLERKLNQDKKLRYNKFL